MSDLIQQAYDAETFRAAGHRLIDLLADKLTEVLSGQVPKVLEWSEPPDAFARIHEYFDGAKEDLFERTWQDCIRLHDPRFVGHQICPPVPIASLAGLMSDFVNNGMGIYEMGIAGTCMERYVVETVARQFGFDDSAGGVLTSGGSLGNLTALLAARQTIAQTDVWELGTAEPFAVMVSDQAHYCVDRAVRIMGWGEDGLIKLPTKNYQVDCERLEEELNKATESGRQVIAVVGSACCTATGQFDDLKKMGEFCRQHEIWFHVDGAHGAASAFSTKYRHLVDGIEMADSVVMDFHKMLLTPAITTALVFRDGGQAFQSFSQKALYLLDDQHEWFDLAKRTFECTKTMMSLKVFSILVAHGLQIFDDYVTKVTDLAREFASEIAQQDDFELAIEPQTNIVCFRFVGGEAGSSDLSQLNELNRRLRFEVMSSGKFYLVQTTLDGTVWLRTTLSNPFTTLEHLRQLLDEIRTLVSRISNA